MADDNLKDLTAAQKQTNETLLKINENIRKQLEGVKEAVKEPPKDIEAEKEKKAENKKFLEGLKGVLKSAGGSAVGGGKSLLDGDNFFSQVWHKTLGGTLPFIFQPDNTNNNPDQFAICKFKDNSLKATQSAFNVYDISLKIEEVW